ncbi:MAG: hypothetical protein A3F18_00980 [Legionellales bacterium RIFCSPHIGHO2_12_FULL_37_14]|nr:MAG: hypothetical protein A3F18_00980 [Legionellales bacterium RIFCSPHIGHO2_12_FULL_37_14]
MAHNSFKKTIEEDLITLKTLNFEVIPAKQYYKKLLILFGGTWFKLVAIALVGIFIAVKFNRGYQDEKYYDLPLAFILSFGFSVFMMGPLIRYYLIQYHLEGKLKIASIIIEKMRFLGYFFLAIYTLATLPLTYFFFKDLGSGMIICAFIVSVFATQGLFAMEVNRLGIGTLLNALGEIIDKLPKA